MFFLNFQLTKSKTKRKPTKNFLKNNIHIFLSCDSFSKGKK
jgi:hypothetical protein